MASSYALIAPLFIAVSECISASGFAISKAADKIEGIHGKSLNEGEVAAAIEEKETRAFEINPSQLVESFVHF
ncbi:hypothetical protein AAHE18_04G184700 [Arachis hypogaea]